LVAVAPSLARVSENVIASEAPLLAIRVFAGSVTDQFVPSVLVMLTVCVPVPLAYVAFTVSVFDRFNVVQLIGTASNDLRVSGTSVMVLVASPRTCTEHVPKAGCPMIVREALGTACDPGTVAVNGTVAPLVDTVLVIDALGMVTVNVLPLGVIET
jgi:hypothetical protein